MRQHWFTNALGAVAIAAGTSWTQTGAAYAGSFTPPPDNASPHNATGGASRGNFFTPPPDNASPGDATGGASRGNFFIPPPDNASPHNATGGASRGNFFTPPPDNASPGNATGGASRGSSLTPLANGDISQNAALQNGLSRSNAYGAMYSAIGQKIPAMVAVTPSSFYGTTLKARPTILVYVPSSDASEAVFSLKDEAKNMVYQKVISVPKAGGIVAIDMPAEAPELAVGANYQWYVAMKLHGELSPASPFVDGWVQRMMPNAELTAALSEGDDLQNAKNLGANGIWYDTVAQMAILRAAQPSVEADGAIAAHWIELLESVGLAEIAAAPIVL
ncbi:MAG: DUF928 domain-containing protein [Phormidesmis sp.]